MGPSPNRGGTASFLFLFCRTWPFLLYNSCSANFLYKADERQNIIKATAEKGDGRLLDVVYFYVSRKTLEEPSSCILFAL